MLDHRVGSLTCLLLPLADRYLLLPNVAIAELIDYQRGEPSSDSRRGTCARSPGATTRCHSSALKRHAAARC